MKKRIPLALLISLLLIILLLSIAVSAFVGSGLEATDVGNYFLQKLPFAGKLIVPNDLPVNLEKIMNYRLPRIFLAVIVGAGLAWSGAVFQSLFRNPLADPYFLGVSAGASFGSTLALVCGFALFGFIGLGVASLFAFVFALAAVFTVYLLARNRGRIPLTNLILAGIAVSAVLTALVSALMLLARERLDAIVLATMGSFSRATPEKVLLAYPAILISMLITFFFARDLNLMLFGEEHAFGLGVNVESRKRLILILTSFTASICVATSGIIWFVGLIVPHMLRFSTGPDNRRLLPASALAGAILLVAADALSRTLFDPIEIPIGILTALAGAPFFIYLLQKSKKSSAGNI
jgi:iron complex transport system permease protein